MKLLAVLLGILSLMMTSQLNAAPPSLSVEQKARNDGLYLFKTLCGKEEKVELIMLVKTAPPEIGAYTKELSAQARESLALIEELQKESPSIKLDQEPLPQVEVDTRASIQEDKQHSLLFGTKGPAFSRALVVTQIEACMYAKHLTLVLAKNVKRESQQKALLKNSAQWDKLMEKGFTLLGSKVVR